MKWRAIQNCVLHVLFTAALGLLLFVNAVDIAARDYFLRYEYASLHLSDANLAAARATLTAVRSADPKKLVELTTVQKDGQTVFTNAEIAHLADVRMIFAWIHPLQFLAALVLITLGFFVRKQLLEFLNVGTLVTSGVAIVLLVVGVTNFTGSFSLFHHTLFPAVNYVFATESMLIQLFPESFWQMAEVAGLLLVLGQAGVIFSVTKLAFK